MRGGKQFNPAFFNQKPDHDTIVVGAPPKQGGVTKFMEMALKKAKECGTLNLQGKGLKVFPAEIVHFNDLSGVVDNWWQGFDLTKIDLSNNEIPEIPDGIGENIMVQHFNFNQNCLIALPAAIFTLENLKFLDVSHNKLFQIPEAIG